MNTKTTAPFFAITNQKTLVRFALIAAAVVFILALLGWQARQAVTRSGAFQTWVIERAFNANTAANVAAKALVDAPELRVVLCGTGSPLANANRAGPCAAIFAGGRIWLVDAGVGGWRNMMLWHVPGNQIAAVLLTHFHSDHIGDLGEVNAQTWIAGRPHPLPVYGGPGVDTVVGGFLQAYALDTTYRTKHHGAQAMPPDVEAMVPQVVAQGDGTPLHEGQVQTVLDQDGMKITAIGVNHAPISPAYAYRFDYGGRSVVISGDTKASPDFATAIAGVDVLVHEAQANNVLAVLHNLLAEQGNTRLAKMTNDIQLYHTSPAQAGDIANRAGAKLLVLTHLIPPIPASLSEPFFMVPLRHIRPADSLLGHDGLMISLPAHADQIDVGELH